MGDLSPWHILVILIVAFILFGGKRLPEVGRSLAETIREFKKALNEPPQAPPPVPPSDVKASLPAIAPEAKPTSEPTEPKKDD